MLNSVYCLQHYKIHCSKCNINEYKFYTESLMDSGHPVHKRYNIYTMQLYYIWTRVRNCYRGLLFRLTCCGREAARRGNYWTAKPIHVAAGTTPKTFRRPRCTWRHCSPGWVRGVVTAAWRHTIDRDRRTGPSPLGGGTHASATAHGQKQSARRVRRT